MKLKTCVIPNCNNTFEAHSFHDNFCSDQCKLQDIKLLVTAYRSKPNALMMDISFSRIEYLIEEVEKLQQIENKYRVGKKDELEEFLKITFN